MTQPTIADLLALRDGEPLPAERQQAIAQDVQAQNRLQRLQQIKAALADLPDEVPGDLTWENIVRRAGVNADKGQQLLSVPEPASTRRWRLPYPLATAAGVFFAAVLGSLLWLPQLGDNDPALGPTLANTAPVPQLTNQDSMAALIDRSQRLEAVARLPVARAVDGQERSRQALLQRIADLDAELNSLIAEEPMDPALKEKLWRQRIDLLETLVAVQQDQLRQVPDLY